MKVNKIFLFMFMLSFIFAGNALAERTVTDMSGRAVTIPDKVYRAFPVGHAMPISLAIAPENTAVVNRTGDDFVRFSPPSFREGKVGVGSASPDSIINPNLPRKKGIPQEDAERVKPDLIIMEGTKQSVGRADEVQKRTNVPVIVVDQDMGKYEESFALLGEVFDEKIQAARMVGYLKKYLYPVHERAGRIPERDRISFYYAHGNEGLDTEPGGNKHVQPMEYINAVNIYKTSDFAEGEKSYVATLDDIIRLKPDVILVASTDVKNGKAWKEIHNNPKWQDVEAVKDNRIYQTPWLPYSWLDRPPGSNRILGSIWMAKTFYPDVFKDLNLSEVIKQYFEVFYHLTITEEDIKDLVKNPEEN